MRAGAKDRAAGDGQGRIVAEQPFVARLVGPLVYIIRYLGSLEQHGASKTAAVGEKDVPQMRPDDQERGLLLGVLRYSSVLSMYSWMHGAWSQCSEQRGMCRAHPHRTPTRIWLHTFVAAIRSHPIPLAILASAPTQHTDFGGH